LYYLVLLLFLQLFASITSPLLLIITHFHYFLMELLRITTITTITTHYSPEQLADARSSASDVLRRQQAAGALAVTVTAPTVTGRPFQAGPNYN
jgi:hypothetical protein